MGWLKIRQRRPRSCHPDPGRHDAAVGLCQRKSSKRHRPRRRPRLHRAPGGALPAGTKRRHPHRRTRRLNGSTHVQAWCPAPCAGHHNRSHSSPHPDRLHHGGEATGALSAGLRTATFLPMTTHFAEQELGGETRASASVVTEAVVGSSAGPGEVLVCSPPRRPRASSSCSDQRREMCSETAPAARPPVRAIGRPGPAAVPRAAVLPQPRPFVVPTQWKPCFAAGARCSGTAEGSLVDNVDMMGGKSVDLIRRT
ncbi:hypothetical protein QO019_001962 [Streptomyces thermodiastaticus]|jgi:hypothetical protein|uniref:Uncharacterized protein n=1 Tax=Streptomyces thermodiastaticus TaxID=44061 RepID=A0ABU0KCK3_9ACTN|nr:hypothetical protein [Streptomyces thermodiastaticus]